jgi:hypothetical protein
MIRARDQIRLSREKEQEPQPRIRGWVIKKKRVSRCNIIFISAKRERKGCREIEREDEERKQENIRRSLFRRRRNLLLLCALGPFDDCRCCCYCCGRSVDFIFIFFFIPRGGKREGCGARREERKLASSSGEGTISVGQSKEK